MSRRLGTRKVGGPATLTGLVEDFVQYVFACMLALTLLFFSSDSDSFG